MSFFSREVSSLRVTLGLLMAVPVFLVANCTYFWATEPRWERLRPDMTVAQAIGVMGPPTDDVAVETHFGDRELWYSVEPHACKLYFRRDRLESVDIAGAGKYDPLRKYTRDR